MNKIKLGHLYPRHLNLYGDLGNIICLSARAHWRDLDFEIENIEPDANADLSQFNILFIGGGQDEQQSLIANDFFKYKNQLEAGLARGQCLIAVCGGYQLLGKTYETSEGRKIAGLGIFDIETRAALRQANEKQNRLVGNVVADLNLQLKQPQANLKTLVGFENHAGRTFILPNSDTKSLAEIKKGSGNNAEDLSEGAYKENFIGTYLHGSLLPKNPHLADEILYRALVSQGLSGIADEIFSHPLDDKLEFKAHQRALSLN